MDAQTASPTRRKVLFGRRPRGPQLSAFGPGYAPTAGGGAGEKLLFLASCWRARPGDQPRHRRSVPSGQGGTTNPSNVGIKRFRDGSAGPRFVLAQAPAENGLLCGTHGGPGEDASAEQNGRGEFSKPTKAPGHGRAQERYGKKRAREKRRRSVTLRSFFDEPARSGRTK